MANIPDGDKQFLDEAWEKMLRAAGISEHAFSWKLSELIDQGSDTNTTVGTLSATNNLRSDLLASYTSAPLVVEGNVADGATAIGVKISNITSLSNAGAKIAAFYPNNAVSEVLAIHKSGKLIVDSTDESGTPGDATINKPSGIVAIAAGQSAVTVTNSLVSATSVVMAVLQQVDGTLTQILTVVPGPGSFVVTGNAAATAATKVAFWVLN